jgi:TrmH family RNA methyltransferase
MPLPKLKRYNKDFEYSYSFGTYPTLDLLKFRKEKVLKVLFKSKINSDSRVVEEIKDICRAVNIPFEINDKAIDRIAYKENTYVVGIFEKYSEELSRENDHVVLVNPRNMGNIGTIIRTMNGFDFNDLALIKPAADIFDPKVVRSTMGAVFQIRFKYFDSIDEYIDGYGNHNFYTFMLNGKEEIKDVKFVSPFSLIQGNESEGLSEKYLNIGKSIYIKHSKDIDSLNLSIATGIGIWESRRGKTN